MLKEIINFILIMPTRYGVDLRIYLAIYFISWPPLAYTWYWIGKIAFKKHFSLIEILKDREFLVALILNRTSWISPFIYVYFWGRDLPSWFWFIISIWFGIGLISFGFQLNEKFRKKERM